MVPGSLPAMPTFHAGLPKAHGQSSLDQARRVAVGSRHQLMATKCPLLIAASEIRRA